MQLLRDPRGTATREPRSPQIEAVPGVLPVVSHHAFEDRAAREVDDAVPGLLDVVRYAARWATFIRIPQRLCCPSRRVWSMISISAIDRFLCRWSTARGQEDGSSQPVLIASLPKSGATTHAPLQVDRRVDAFDLEAVKASRRLPDRVVAVRAGDHQLGESASRSAAGLVAGEHVGVDTNVGPSRRAPAGDTTG